MTDSAAPLLDYIKASEARDSGISRTSVKNASFIDAGLDAIAQLPPGMEAQGEDIRARLVGMGIVPETHQAWGALIRTAVTRGLLVKTGRFAKTRSLNTHRHPTEVYRTPGRSA